MTDPISQCCCLVKGSSSPLQVEEFGKVFKLLNSNLTQLPRTVALATSSVKRLRLRFPQFDAKVLLFGAEELAREA